MEHAMAWVFRTLLFIAGVAVGSTIGATVAMKIAANSQSASGQ